MNGEETCHGEHDWRYRKEIEKYGGGTKIDRYEVYYCRRCLQRRYVWVESVWPSNGTHPKQGMYYDGQNQTTDLQV